MARSAAAARGEADETATLAVAYYRHRLVGTPARLPESAYPPVRIGPTWQIDDAGHWLLPERSLGWQVLGWSAAWLQHAPGEGWRYTDEQARWLLWWYATDEAGRFIFRDGVLQRLKGWGKDPLGACIGAVELLGPCRFSGEWGADGQPMGMQVAEAWVQNAATSHKQTQNQMRLFPGLFTAEAKARWGITVGKEIIYADGGTRMLQAVTSSHTTLEGARATFVLKNETQHWKDSNDGHDMAAVISRNATKSPDGAARSMAITNAYDPAQDSSAQRDREAFEAQQGGGWADFGLMYDSLEAPPDAPLTAEAAPEVAKGVRGDAVWLDLERIVQSVLDVREPPSRSRRFWYNQQVATEESWIAPHDYDACHDPDRELAEGEEVVLFFDGSKSGDATALAGCAMSDGYVFLLDIWQKGKDAPPNWTTPRSSVDASVRGAFERLNVLAFWADPGTGDDDDGQRYWDALFDRWADDLSGGLKLPAVATGRSKHAIIWDMRSPAHTEAFTEACERFSQDVIDGTLRHDGDRRLRQHVINAHRRPNRYGVSIGKESRGSKRKIDAAVCAVGARMIRRQLLSGDGMVQKRTGKVW